MPITISTLGDLAPSHHLTAHCNGCSHSKKLDNGWLVETFGAGFPISKVTMKLYCPKCKSRDISATIGYAMPGKTAVSM